MDAIKAYYDKVSFYIDKVLKEEEQNINKAAVIMANVIAEDRLIYVVGTGGHSFIGAEDFFGRAGGLFPIQPIFEPSVSLSFGALRSGALERLPGIMPRIMANYELNRGDPLVIVNAYGINSATIDTAITAKEKGLILIAITSKEYQINAPPDLAARHPSKKNLYELADITIDSKVPLGDAVVDLNGFDQKVSPVSTILNSFCIQSLVAATCEKLIAMGIKPPVWTSGNIAGGDEKNAVLIQKYKSRIRYLWRYIF
ncbi:MAG: sugar isomerase domain-containing protein [Thermoprotei archaeon]